MKRREFFEVAGTCLSTVWALSASREAMAGTGVVPAGDRKIRKGFMLGTFRTEPKRDIPLLEQFQMLKEAGFESVEPASGLDRGEVLRARDATGLEVASVVVANHWREPLSSPDAGVRASGLEGLKTALKDAQVFGARSVLLVPAVVNKDVSYDEAYQRSQEEIRKAVPMAEELDVQIAIENVWNHFLLSPLEAARYVDEFESPAVRWHFDVGNIINYGWPEQWIRILGDRIVTLHIKEFSRKRRDEEGLWKGFDVELLEGDDDWPAVMAALDAIKFEGWGIVEPPYRAPGQSDMEWLKKLSAQMDEIFQL